MQGRYRRHERIFGLMHQERAVAMQKALHQSLRLLQGRSRLGVALTRQLSHQTAEPLLFFDRRVFFSGHHSTFGAHLWKGNETHTCRFRDLAPESYWENLGPLTFFFLGTFFVSEDLTYFEGREIQIDGMGGCHSRRPWRH